MSISIVLIGAGSTVFTPGLLVDFARSSVLSGATVHLVDIDLSAVEVMTALGRRISANLGSSLRVEGSTDRREALAGADFVTTTIAVGGASGWERDMRIAAEFGVGQTVGDTVGPGGLLRALRHIPELVSIATDIADLAPTAWLVNYSNPLTANVRAITSQTPVRTIGLCHGTMHSSGVIADELGVSRNAIRAIFAGVNHLCWLTDLRLSDGSDLYPQWRDLVLKRAGGPQARSSRTEGAHQAVSADLMQIYGLYPAPGDRHVAEFFPWYLKQPRSGAELGWGLQGGQDRTWEYIAEKAELWDRLRSQAFEGAPLDPILQHEAQEAERLVDIIEALVTGREHVELAVNMPNNGALVDLPRDAVIETPAVIGAAGVRPVNIGCLPTAVTAVLEHRIHQQELTVRAALTADPTDALAALVADPLVPDTMTARSILEAGLHAHAAHLPAAWSAPSARSSVAGSVPAEGVTP